MDNFLIEEFEHADCTVKIYQDPDPRDPRKDFDNAGVMACTHRRYELGDVQFNDGDALLYHVIEALLPPHERARFEAWKDSDSKRTLRTWMERAEKYGVVLPLYLYDHSGITMRTTAFSCPWDSGQVGFIYCTDAKIKEEWNGDREAAEKCLVAEVSTYDDYLTGAVYGFVVCDKATGNFDDSCWGFIGDAFEYCKDEARSAAESIQAQIARDLLGVEPAHA